jgi:RNA polymerase sigma factor (sigma-70 family)
MRRAASTRNGDSPASPEVEGILLEHEGVLRIAFRQGQVAYPDLPLTYERFARRLVEIVHRRPVGAVADTGPGHFMRRLSRVVGTDIFLAIACEDRIPGAWETFNRTHAEEVRRAASRYRSLSTDSEEIAEGLVGELFSPPADGVTRTRLGSYDGSGPLGAWLLAVLRNRLVDARRSQEGEARRRLVAGRRKRIDRPPARTEEPPHSMAAEEARGRFESALGRAWETLTPLQQFALTLKFRDGRRQIEIAELLGVGEPRVSRMVSKGVDRLRQAIRAEFHADSDEALQDMWDAMRTGSRGGFLGLEPCAPGATTEAE